MELSDAEVFGTQELSDAEVFGNVGFDDRILQNPPVKRQVIPGDMNEGPMTVMDHILANPVLRGVTEFAADIPRNLFNAPGYLINQGAQVFGGKPVVYQLSRGESVVPEVLPQLQPNSSIGMGVAKGGEDLVRGLLTPENLMTLGAGTSPQLMKAIGTLFGLSSVAHLPHTASEVGRLSVEGTPAETARAATQMTGEAAIGGHQAGKAAFGSRPAAGPEMVTPEVLERDSQPSIGLLPSSKPGEVIDLNPQKTAQGTVYKAPGDVQKMIEGPKGEFITDEMGNTVPKSQFDPLQGQDALAHLEPKKAFSGDRITIGENKGMEVPLTGFPAIEAKLNEILNKINKEKEIIPVTQNLKPQEAQPGESILRPNFENQLEASPGFRKTVDDNLLKRPLQPEDFGNAIEGMKGSGDDAASLPASQEMISGEGGRGGEKGKAPQIEDGNKPLNPGGAEKDLSPEQQALSRKNNSLREFARANGVEYVEGDTPQSILKKVNAKSESNSTIEANNPKPENFTHILGNIQQKVKFAEGLGDITKEQAEGYRKRGDEIFNQSRTDPAGAREQAKKLNDEVRGSKKDPRTGEDLYGGIPFLDPEFWKKNFGEKSYVRRDAEQLYNFVRNKMGKDSNVWKAVDTLALREYVKANPMTTVDEFKNKVQEELGKHVQGVVSKNNEWWKGVQKETEVHSYGMEGKVSEAKREYDRMTHEWYDNMSHGQREAVKAYWRAQDNGKQLPMLPKELAEKADKYTTLQKAVNSEPRDTSPRATQYYSTVSALPTDQPMPEWTVTKSGKNVQRVDVVIPTEGSGSKIVNRRDVAGQYSGYEPLWSPDNLHENLPNTLGWAMIQYKTGAKGEKIAVIAEAQSRWGQERREAAKREEKINQNVSPNMQAEMRRVGSYPRVADHPLLRDYNRLILKAAIEQARKEGATHIMVSDAETAMMTEGHDIQGYELNRYQDKDGKIHESREGPNTQYGHYLLSKGMKWLEKQRVIEQEPGMRFNYDTILPKIAEELTGSKGEKVSLGEHKNAYETKGESVDLNKVIGNKDFTRSNLIFHKPDGSPKTDISGHLYSITSKPTSSDGLGRAMQSAVTKNSESGTINFQPLTELWDEFKATALSRKPKERISQLLDAADNQAKIYGKQVGNRLRQMLPDKLDRQAVTFIIESGEDQANLATMLAKASANAKAVVAIRHAQSNWNRLKSYADSASSWMDQQRTDENTQGIATDETENYIKHAYDMQHGLLFNGRRGVSGVGSAFKKQRTYTTYADAIKAGLKPITLDAADLIQSRITAGTKMINRAKWGQSLGALTDPTTKLPITTTLIKQPKGTLVAPRGYAMRSVLPGIQIAVHDGYTGIFDALTGGSFVQNSSIGRGLLKTEGLVKHGLLLFDSFHASRMMQKQLFLTGRVGYNLGLSMLEYDLPTIARMETAGDIEPEAAAWVRKNKPTADLLIKNGLNVGRISEALYNEWARKELPIMGVDVNIPGRFNKWVFDKLTRGAMMESSISEFYRIKKQQPSWSDTQVASHVAKQINVYFGNLSRQGVFKSEGMRDVLTLAFLAPQWVESMVQNEVRSYKQIGQIPLDAAMKKTINVGVMAKAMLTGVGAYILATQLINLYTRKQPTFKNKEEGHKLDAWIPDPTGKTDGFWLNPLSVPAEMTHDWFRYTHSKANQFEVASQIIANKMSPLARTEETLRTRQDYAGNKILGVKEVAKQAAKSMLPLPLFTSGLTSDSPGQMVRQGFGMVGLKVEPANKRVADAAKMEDKTVSERIEAENEKEKEPLSLQSRYSMAQRATDREFQRQKEVYDGLTGANKKFIDGNKLTLRGYDPAVSFGKTKLRLSEAEAEKYEKMIIEEYNTELRSLREESEVNQTILDKALTRARKRALLEFKSQMKD